ncbi:MAG: GspH/FimT family pseudopilin [Magnetococcus sp. WYHC-3]
MRQRCPDLGFTLIELLATLVILGVLAMLGLPPLMDSVQDMRLTSRVNTLVGLLHRARSEAVQRALPVTLCPSVDGISCAAAGSGWEQGHLLFANDDPHLTSNPVALRNANDTLIQVQPPLATGLTLRPLPASLAAVTFLPDGSLSGTVAVEFLLCAEGDLRSSRAVVLGRQGRVRLLSDDNGDGLLEDDNGTAFVTCTP